MKKLVIKILAIVLVFSMSMFIVGCGSCNGCDHECDADWIIDKQATCTEDGARHGDCKTCGKFLSETIEKLGHDYTITTKTSSCVNNGYSIYECLRCGYVDISDFKSGHAYSDWVNKKIPTCTEDGYEEQICSTCGEFNRNTLKALGHSYTPISSETIDSFVYVTYECETCKNTQTLKEGELVSDRVGDDLLFDVEPSFSFTIKTAEDEAYIRENLKIIDAYFNNTKYEDYDEINIDYTLTKQDSISTYSSDKIEYIWVVTPIDDYEHDTTYMAKLAGNVEFEACSAQTMTFTTASAEDHVNKIVYRDDIVFLKTLEINSPGYYPYSLEHIIPSSDDSEESYALLSLIVGKVDGIEIGQILCVGDVTNTNEITDDTDCDFGKVDNFYQLSSGQWMIVLSEPELEEIFEELDISYEEEVDFESSDVDVEQVEAELVNSLYQSESFTKFLASANVASKAYASERDLDVSYIATADNFMKNISIKPSISFSGNNLYGKLTGELKIPLKNSNKKDIGNLTVTFVFDVESSFNIDVRYQLKKKKFLGIVYGIKYFDLSLTQSDTIGFSFDINIDVDYSLEEGKYIQNVESEKIHRKGCVHLASVKDNDKLKDITAKNAEKQIAENPNRECKHCLPTQGFNYDLLIINKAQGVIHAYNCTHVGQIREQNKEISQEKISILITQGYTCCDWCSPDEREEQSYNKHLKESLNYSDWKQVAVDISSWAKDSGYEESITNNQYITGVDIPIAWPISASIDIYFILEFDLEASLSYDYKYKQTNRYGMRIEDGKPQPYSLKYSQTVEDDLTLMGKSHVEAGLKVDANVNISGLKKWIRAGVTADVGLYADVSGVIYINNNSNSTDQNYAAAYLEVGVEIEVDAYYKLFSWENGVDIYSVKDPFLQKGYDKAYYGYASPVEKLEVDGYYDIESLLEVKYLELKTLTSKEGKLYIDGVDGLYDITLSLEKGEFFDIVDGKIIEPTTAPAYFEDTLTITVTSNTSWKNYFKGSSIFYIKEYVITLVGSGDAILEDLVFTLNEEKTEYSVTGYTGTSTEVYIPATYDNKPVTSIGESAFFDCHSLTSITIGDGVTTIDNGAFSGCDSLTSIEIPDSVTSIYGWTFIGCESLTSITVDENNTRFKSMDGNLYTKDGKILGQYAIGKKEASFVVPNSVTTISDVAFAWCSSLTSITIGENVSSIGLQAFSFCESLTSITVDVNNTTYKSIDGNLYSKDGKTLIQYAVGKTSTSFIIPEGVTSIGDCAFQASISLKNIEIPNNVTHIGGLAFGSCASLTSIIIPESVSFIGGSAFYEWTSGQIIYCSIESQPNSWEIYWNEDCLAEIIWGYKPTTEGLVFTLINNDTEYKVSDYTGTSTEVYIPTNYNGKPVTSIGDYAFSYCGSLTSVTIGDSVTSIGDYAFSGCESLTSITIGDSVTSIGYCAFADCSSLTSIIIPDSVKSIGDIAFSNCSSLTSIIIPDSVKSIGGGAFLGCSSLTSIIIGDGVTSIGADAFRYCDSLTSITIPDSVTSIGERAFSRCSSLTSITIPDSVTSIGDYAFSRCSSLTSIEIPDSVTSIGNGAFRDCYSLTSIIVDENNTTYKSIDGNLYSKDGKTLIQYAIGKTATSFAIPNTVTSIGNYAFAYCSSLTSITIPESVTTIGSYAFYSCDSLTSVTIPDSVTSIGDYAFSGCSSLETIYCEAESQPNGWSSSWKYYCNAQVVWGYKGK